MRPRHALATTFAVAAILAALPAGAQEAGATAPEARPDGLLSTQGRRERSLVFSVLLGAQSRPAYFGADETEGAPLFSPNVMALQFGGFEAGDPSRASAVDPRARPPGLSVSPTFRFVSERESDEHDELAGLEDVDLTLEVGAQVAYAWANAEAYGQVRYGLGGSEAWVGELGAYYVARPVDRLAFRVGPRLLFGSDAYADTYFGVTADESAAGALAEYDPDAGLVSAGVEMIATWQLGDRWWLEGRARWDQFQQDAADSPIVEQGSREQGTISIGVRRAFVLEF